MNEFERERDARIANNKRRMAELGIGASAQPGAVARPTGAARSRRVAPRSDPTRRSSRDRPPVTYATQQLPREPTARGEPRAAHGLDRGTLDPVNGTSCHFCRQRTDVAKAKCSRCTVQICPPCLKLRFGLLMGDIPDDYECPKCLGTCNCSICRRKNGQEPTGILAPIALREGFSSVAEYLKARENK